MNRVIGKVSSMKFRRIDLLAIFIGILAVGVWVKYDTYKDNLRPASDWFTINKISIPDFEEGTDPLVLYDRSIKLPFYGEGKSEVRDISGAIPNVVCTGSWDMAYEPGDVLDTTKITFNWILGARVIPSPCEPKAGQYVTWISVRVKPLNGVEREVTYLTDTFIIYPKGGQLYITPEQVKKLDE